jgi:hypothetical protein
MITGSSTFRIPVADFLSTSLTSRRGLALATAPWVVIYGFGICPGLILGRGPGFSFCVCWILEIEVLVRMRASASRRSRWICSSVRSSVSAISGPARVYEPSSKVYGFRFCLKKIFFFLDEAKRCSRKGGQWTLSLAAGAILFRARQHKDELTVQKRHIPSSSIAIWKLPDSPPQFTLPG